MKVPSFISGTFLGRHNFDANRLQPQPGGGVDFTSYDIDYIKQKHANMCGDACVLMLSNYYSWGLNINLKKNKRGAAEGLDIGSEPAYMNHFISEGHIRTSANLEYRLKMDGPLCVSGNYAKMGVLGTQGHWVVLKGCDHNNFYVHCPWSGANYPWPKDKFINALDEVLTPIK